VNEAAPIGAFNVENACLHCGKLARIGSESKSEN
jgi:hypothetical protein